MASSNEAKQAERKRLRKLRNEIEASERERMDAAIAQAVIHSKPYQEADIVCAYAAFGSEIATREIIEDAWEQGKLVVLPRCVPGTRDMEWYQVDSFDGMETSPMGMDEPAAVPDLKVEEFTERAITLVPGLTFDPQGYRMGYGGGFYDAFLADFPGTSIGLCREPQMSESVECRESHDLPVTLVITDERIHAPEQE